MGMTMTQKILAAASGKQEVKSGELIMANLSLVLGNDITSSVAIDELKKINCNKIFDKDKIALVPDHFTPNKDIKSAMQCQKLREFVNKNEITNYFEVGQMGIEHALLPEKGFRTPDLFDKTQNAQIKVGTKEITDKIIEEIRKD